MVGYFREANDDLVRVTESMSSESKSVAPQLVHQVLGFSLHGWEHPRAVIVLPCG